MSDSETGQKTNQREYSSVLFMVHTALIIEGIFNCGLWGWNISSVSTALLFSGFFFFFIWELIEIYFSQRLIFDFIFWNKRIYNFIFIKANFLCSHVVT